MISARHLGKSWRGRPVLDDVELEVGPGEVFGLLGANGAGKSTLLGIMLGLVRPDRGEVFIGGVSVQRDRRRALEGVGAQFETPGFYGGLSGWQNLQALSCFGEAPSRTELDAAVELAGLGPRIHERVRDYSHGMRQRLALALALVPRPRLVILDEPMNGLDPAGVRDFRAVIDRVRDEWRATVVLASHRLSEIERMCRGVAILHQGRIAFAGDWRVRGADLEATYFDVTGAKAPGDA